MSELAVSGTNDKIEEMIEDFEYLESWEDRFRYIIDLGRKLSPMADDLKSEETKVDGCTSQVWMVAEREGAPPVLRFTADSDAHIVRGLIAILLAIYDGRAPAEILEIDAKSMITRLGFEQHLSPNRANGLYAMVGRIRKFAAEAAAG